MLPTSKKIPDLYMSDNDSVNSAGSEPNDPTENQYGTQITVGPANNSRPPMKRQITIPRRFPD